MLKGRLIENIKRERDVYTSAIKLVEGLSVLWVHSLIMRAEVDRQDGNFVITLGREACETASYDKFIQYLRTQGYDLGPRINDDQGRDEWLTLIHSKTGHVVEVRQAER